MKNVFELVLALTLALLIGYAAPELGRLVPSTPTAGPSVDWNDAHLMSPIEVEQQFKTPMGTPTSPDVHPGCSQPQTREAIMTTNECYESWVNGNRNHVACYCAQHRPAIAASVTALIARNTGSGEAENFATLVKKWQKEPRTDFNTV